MPAPAAAAARHASNIPSPNLFMDLITAEVERGEHLPMKTDVGHCSGKGFGRQKVIGKWSGAAVDDDGAAAAAASKIWQLFKEPSLLWYEMNGERGEEADAISA